MPPARALHEWRKLKKWRVAGFEPASALSYQSARIYCFKGGLADYNAACRGRCMGKKRRRKNGGRSDSNRRAFAPAGAPAYILKEKGRLRRRLPGQMYLNEKGERKNGGRSDSNRRAFAPAEAPACFASFNLCLYYTT